MTDEGLALARSLGARTIDLQRGMREVQRRIVAARPGGGLGQRHATLVTSLR
jgi:hypothetical protein